MLDPKIIERLKGLVLSANELKALTNWPDALIEDYLNILDNLIMISNLLNIGIDKNIDFQIYSAPTNKSYDSRIIEIERKLQIFSEPKSYEKEIDELKIGVFATPILMTDHGSLAGLGDDDHTQYVLLAGTRPEGTKNPPIDADKVIYRDSAAADVLVTSTWAQIKAFLKTYLDTLYNLYVHPNHSGDVTSIADGAQTIVDKQTLTAIAPITLSNTPTVIAAVAPVIAIPAATALIDGYATVAQITKLDGIEALADVTSTHETSHATVVTAAANIGDHKLVRGDGGAKGVQESTIVVDDSGRMLNPSQPAFHVKPSVSQSNIPINTMTTIVFDLETFDVGNNFASNLFTAPITGKYQLNVQLMLRQVDTASVYIQLQIITSNTAYYNIIHPNFSGDLTNMNLTYSTLADMDANDIAYVRLYQSEGSTQLDVGPHSHFTGALIC